MYNVQVDKNGFYMGSYATVGTVKDGVDVNVKLVIVDILTDFSKAIKSNINYIFDQAEEQISQYKQCFYSNIDRLDKKIAEILQRLSEDTEKEETIAQKVENEKSLLEWISRTEDRIRTLLSL